MFGCMLSARHVRDIVVFFFASSSAERVSVGLVVMVVEIAAVIVVRD